MMKFSNRGFTLVEVLIASGMLGGLALYLMNVSQKQIVVEKRAETSFEINTISGSISQSLLNKESCSSTLGIGNVITDGTALNVIRNRSGNVMFDKNVLYSNNQLKINDIKVSELVTSSIPSGNKYGEAKVEITFEKVSKILDGNKTIIKKFPIQIELGPTNQLISCFSGTDNAILTAKMEACKSIDGIFDIPTDKCQLKSFDSAGIDTNYTAISTKSQRDFFDHAKINELDPRFVNITGDTMTGKLNVQEDVTSTTRFCVNGKCRNFDAEVCPTGRVVKEIKEDGSVVCANVTCPDPNTFYVGINASGSPICKAFPTNTCSANQYVSKVNPDGSVVCSNLPPGTNKNCPGGAIQSIDGAGNHTCLTIDPDTNVYGKLCSPGQVLRGFDGSGNMVCETPAGSVATQIVTGANSPCRGSSTATCPAGTTLISGGHQWVSSCGCGEEHRFLLNSYPSGNSWTTRMECSVHKAYAICLKN